VAKGGRTGAPDLPDARKVEHWFFLSAVDVPAAPGVSAVVALGDSITDGHGATTNGNDRWTDVLAARLQAAHARAGVLNHGIGGNRVLLDGGDGFGPAALSRFDRDAVQQTGVRSVIILEGINDIQQTPHQLDPARIIAGLRQLVDRAHAAGLRAIGGTLLPFEGWSTYDAQEEAARQGVNDWIRNGGAYDAVADFDAALRDPADPHRMLPVYDSGDHLHPGDLGYAAMADAVNLSTLLR
jgi:lysophospholipase L1-like esterase